MQRFALIRNKKKRIYIFANLKPDYGQSTRKKIVDYGRKEGCRHQRTDWTWPSRS
jgi:hypothetical protein